MTETKKWPEAATAVKAIEQRVAELKTRFAEEVLLPPAEHHRLKLAGNAFASLEKRLADLHQSLAGATEPPPVEEPTGVALGD